MTGGAGGHEAKANQGFLEHVFAKPFLRDAVVGSQARLGERGVRLQAPIQGRGVISGERRAGKFASEPLSASVGTRHGAEPLNPGSSPLFPRRDTRA